jgi:hypothetical protein
MGSQSGDDFPIADPMPSGKNQYLLALHVTVPRLQATHDSRQSSNPSIPRLERRELRQPRILNLIDSDRRRRRGRQHPHDRTYLGAPARVAER